MTVPRKKGFRTIVVAGHRFKWRFAKRIVVVADDPAWRKVLEVDFGWVDSWLYMPDLSSMPPESTTDIATPAFVSSAIEFAMNSGWTSGTRGGCFLVKHSVARGFETMPTSAIIAAT